MELLIGFAMGGVTLFLLQILYHYIPKIAEKFYRLKSCSEQTEQSTLMNIGRKKRKE
jgi:hypothetical protein